ncbi:putative N-ethylmaleimide reductase [Nemania sp. FL0916]|nr:putative N-ethylmaleimide reductase [Nemania sp. FL0916]
MNAKLFIIRCPYTNTHLRFVPVDVQGENTRKTNSQARSHAIKQGLEKKRRAQQQRGLNFRATQSWINMPSFDVQDENQPISGADSGLPNIADVDQFRDVSQPVFSITDELVLPNFCSLYEASPDDPALFNATLLTFKYATSAVIDADFLGYQSRALGLIRMKMDSPNEAASESTLAAILLLAGIDARLTMPSHAQLHMNAVQQLLYIGQISGMRLAHEVKRAIFWQDLNVSVMTGTKRIVDHTTFPELEWKRDPSARDVFIVPAGFRNFAHLLPEELLDVFKDMNALQLIRDTLDGNCGAVSMTQVDNLQASIQSRLWGLPISSAFPYCCQLAAFLCAAILRCKKWRSSVIPSYLPSRLLETVRLASNEPVWDMYPDAVTWILHVGGAFASTEDDRLEYMQLLRANRAARHEETHTTWSELIKVFKRFVWSEKAFSEKMKAFWEEPLKIGTVTLSHRIGMPSLTRRRATDERIPTPMMKEYYSQRASVPGTLILAEGTFISPASCGGFGNAPGIWSEEQIARWRAITDEVHKKGCFIFCQLFGMGRAGDAETTARDGFPLLAPSAVPITEGSPVPREMTVEEIKQTIQEFATAAKNAIRAGFDGVECHGANGYLVDQFIQDTSNFRTDAYGGSVENRSRFVVEVLQAMVDAVGAERVGLRLSPWSTFQGMRMADPIPQFSDVIKKASQLHLAYLDLCESRVAGAVESGFTDTLDFAYKLWDRPILVAGGYTSQMAQQLVDKQYPDKDIVVLFGRSFIANPDLVFRIHQGLEFSPYNRATFYVKMSSKGYLDYPYSKEYLASLSAH